MPLGISPAVSYRRRVDISGEDRSRSSLCDLQRNNPGAASNLNDRPPGGHRKFLREEESIIEYCRRENSLLDNKFSARMSEYMPARSAISPDESAGKGFRVHSALLLSESGRARCSALSSSQTLSESRPIWRRM